MVKQGAFGRPYLSFWGFCSALAGVYEAGAVVGRAKRNSLDIIGKIIRTPQMGSMPMEYLQKEAKENLENFVEVRNREPYSFFDFVALEQLRNAIPDAELKKIPSTVYENLWGDRVKGYSTPDWRREISILMSKNKKVMKVMTQKVSLQDVEIGTRIYGKHGIAFGGLFPELTERMFRNFHEDPNEPVKYTLEEEEGGTLQIVAIYTNNFFPELLDALDLRGYLEKATEEDKQLFSRFRPPRGAL